MSTQSPTRTGGGLPPVVRVALLFALPMAAQSARIDYTVGASVLHSDNIGLSETDPIDETVLSPQFSFTAEQTGSTVQLKARGDAQYLDYRDDSFDDELRGRFAGQLNWVVLPERMNFVVEDYLDRQPINAFNSFTPSNLQQINVFALGPTFYARLNDAHRIQFDLRYGNTYAEDTEAFNGDRYNAAARLLSRFSETTQLSANLEATQVEFDLAGPTSEYTRYDGYAGYLRKLADLDVKVDLGYSRVELERSDRSHSAPLGRASVDWRISARSVLAADASYQFSDSGQDLVARSGDLDSPIIRDPSNADMVVAPDLFRQRLFEGGYKFNGDRLDLEVRGHRHWVRYTDSQTLLPDWNTRGGFLDLGYRVRPRLMLSATAYQETRTFEDFSRTDRDRTLSIGLVNQFTRHWSARIDLQRRTRDSSAAGLDYDENAAIVAVSYRR